MKLGKILLAASIFGLACSSPAMAGFAQGNQVTLGGQPVFSIPAAASGFSPDHRAWITQDRLDNALVLAANHSPDAVTVVHDNHACSVLLDGRLVAVADQASARMEGMSVDQLANKWADSIRQFLADSARTDAYLASLTGKNPINAAVAVIERRLYAPPGTVLPVAFAEPISADCLKPGQIVEGVLTQAVVLGSYQLPEKSIVSGVVQQVGPEAFDVAFNSLKTPAGTVVPINAVLAGPYAAATGPHLVATLNMPYGHYLRYQGYTETDCRIPAYIGIGSMGGTERLVLTPGTNMVFAPGTPMSVVLQTPQQVAVVPRIVM